MERKNKAILLAILNIFLAASPCLLFSLFYYDRESANLVKRHSIFVPYEPKNYDDYRNIGFYPMGGIKTLFFSAIFDVFAVISYVANLCRCECERNYVKWNFINIFVTITGIFLLYASDQETDEYLNYYFKVAVARQYELGSNNTQTHFVDLVQTTQDCCGYESPEEWTKRKDWNSETKLLPSSCCSKPTKCSLTSENLHKVGCKDFVTDPFSSVRVLAKLFGLLKIVVIIVIMLLSATIFREKWSIPNQPWFSRRRQQEQPFMMISQTEADQPDITHL